jgi:hypothetical protein
MKRPLSLGGAMLAGFLASVSAHAEALHRGTGLVSAKDREARGAGPQAFGTSSQSIHQIPAVGCVPIDAATSMITRLNGYRYKTAGLGVLDCPLNLPSGARIEGSRSLLTTLPIRSTSLLTWPSAARSSLTTLAFRTAPS